MVAENESIKILIHASASRFGAATELVIEAIGEAISNKDQVIDLDHFAEAYRLCMSCDDEVDPSISEQWRVIDTAVDMQRYIDEKKGHPAPKRRKYPLLRTAIDPIAAHRAAFSWPDAYTACSMVGDGMSEAGFGVWIVVLIY